MTDWRNFLNEKESAPSRKKPFKPGCKRNKIGRNRLGPCSFTEKDECKFCKRPRKKTLRLDPLTSTIIVEYYE